MQAQRWAVKARASEDAANSYLFFLFRIASGSWVINVTVAQTGRGAYCVCVCVYSMQVWVGSI